MENKSPTKSLQRAFAPLPILLPQKKVSPEMTLNSGVKRKGMIE